MSDNNEIDNTTANDDFLCDILVSGHLVGKLSTMEEVEKVYEDLLNPAFTDSIFNAMIDFIDMQAVHQDELYTEADTIIMDSPAIDEEDDNLRADLSTKLSDSLNGLSAALELVIFGQP